MTDAVQPAEAAKPPARPNPFVGPTILLVWIGLGAWVVTTPSGPGVFAFVMVGWILAVMLHEFSHAAVAWLAGDHTVAEKGYLSFDPRRYGDLGTSLVIPLLVYLRNDLMRSRSWRAAASLAGPLATLVVLLVLSFGLSFWRGRGVEGAGQTALFEALTVIAFLQAMALILNLLPIPGLDGFNAIRPFLPAAWAPAIRKAEGLALLAILVLIFVIPGASAALFTGAAVLGHLTGLDLQALQDGWNAFHFWR
jgi:Zn-dependent protease